jgi:hypothetical protein
MSEANSQIRLIDNPDFDSHERSGLLGDQSRTYAVHKAGGRVSLMSECNCNCCCAYLSPPWWVTMGYAPSARFQAQGSAASTSVPASGSMAGPTGQGNLVQPTPARRQTTSVISTPTVAKAISQGATGDLVGSALSDVVHLL